MKKTILLVSLVAVIGCGAGKTSTGLSTEGPTNILVKGDVGDTYAYTMTTKMEAIGEEGEMGFSATMTEKLAKVEGDVFEWETSFSDLETSASGVMAGGDQAFAMLDGMTMISVQDSRGTVKSMKLGELEIPSEGSSNVVLPPEGTKPGGTWKAFTDMSGQKLEIVYTLEGFEDMNGLKAAKIKGDYPAGGPAKTIEPTEFWVDVSNGKMIKGKGVTEVTVDGKTIRVTYEIDRKEAK